MPATPTGTVTFLFTDIESSSRLWELHPDAMRLALALHDALLRTAIEQNKGYVFKTMGDAFHAAFHTAPDALSAVFAAQQALHTQIWPEPVTIKVRMALHTGAAEARDGDYYGQPLNRVARLLGAGHGGQILLSQTTYDLTIDNLPPACSLQNLGAHRLRDLNRPEQVFQLLHPALPSAFHPLKSLDNPALPNNLPRQMTSFIGRKKEMEQVKNLLDNTRLLTLVGSGGCGKTRLALQVAADALEEFPDGVWLVELAPLADPALAPQTVASILGLAEQAGKSFTQTLTENLKAKKLLLLLDNCEHLLPACAQLTDALLRCCPDVKILASSREGLGIAGEQAYRVPPLSLPDIRQPATVKGIGQYEAARLFIERALLSKTEFLVTSQNAPALALVCHRLDGIPLAIELAAARVRSLSVEEINIRLDNRFRLLTGGSKTALPRQQTLRAAIDWSYDLLTAQERLMIARLSVFVGGWTLKAAEQVVVGKRSTGESIEDWEVFDLLSSLVDKSLALAETQQDTTRYRLLETVRQYANDRLTASEESVTINQKHRDYFLTLAEEAKHKLRSAEQAHWLAVLEEEHDNLRQALTFCLKEPEGGEAGLRLGAALQQFWWTRGHLSEGRDRLTAALSHPGGQECTRARAEALNGAGIMASDQGDYASSRSLYEASLALKRQLGDKRGIAYSLNNLGSVALRQSDYDTAHSLYEASLALKREMGDRRDIAYSLMSLGDVACEQGECAKARPLYIESLAILRELGDTQGIAYSLNNLGRVAHAQGDYDTAHSLHSESLAILLELGDKRGVACSLMGLGYVACARDDYDTGWSLRRESLTISRELGDRYFIADFLEAMAPLAIRRQKEEYATRLWGAASALREAIGSPLSPDARAQMERDVATVRQTLDEAAFAATWEEGRAMTWEQAIAYALEETPL